MMNRHIVRVSWVVVVVCALATQASMAGYVPENDVCVYAWPVTDGTTEFDTLDAGTDGPAHAACQYDGQTYRDIWYEFVPPAYGVLTVSTCDTAYYDTALVVYEGCSCPVTDDMLLACNDDAPGCSWYTSSVTTMVHADVCYKIRVGGFDASSAGVGLLEIDYNPVGTACIDADGDCWGLEPNTTPGCTDTICCDLVCDEQPYCCAVEWDAVCAERAWILCGGPTDFGACCVDETCTGIVAKDDCTGYWLPGQSCPMVDCQVAAMDHCEGAYPIYDGQTEFDTTQATTEGPAHAACDWEGQLYHDVWFDYVAGETGDLKGLAQINAQCPPDPLYTGIMVYDGCDCPVDDDRLLACSERNVPYLPTAESTVTAPVVQGQCYKIRVGGADPDEAGPFLVELSIEPPFDACLGSTESCFGTHDGPGCEDPVCCNKVCDELPACCTNGWTGQCYALSLSLCNGYGACCTDNPRVEEGCLDNTDEAECTGQWHRGMTCNEVNCVCQDCVDADGDCWGLEPNDTPGCSDAICCDAVCDTDEYCCHVQWDDACAQLAWSRCRGPLAYGACCIDDDCVGIMMEDDCDGIWHAGINCAMIDCAQPVADRCPGPVMMPGDAFVGSTVGLTDVRDQPYCGLGSDAPGAWYTVIGNGNTLTATTCASAFTDYDTTLSVYCGNCAELVCVGSNDDASGLGCDDRQSSVSWCSLPDAKYHVLVQGYGQETGNFALSVIDGDACDTGDPACTPVTGACCDGATCVGDMSSEECAGAWYSGMTCADYVCPTGACCMGATCAGTTPESDCTGDWYIGGRCDSFACPTCDYCDVCFGRNNNEYITNVTLGAINRESGRDGLCSHADASHLSANLVPGQAYPISVTVSAEDGASYWRWGQCVSVYVDFNQNCEFDADEVLYLGCDDGPTVTGDLVVPEDAMPGCTGMRVMERWFEAPPDACAIQAYDWGEVEDYTVCLGSLPPVSLLDSVPAHDASLWRSAENHLALTFSGEITMPLAGTLTVQQLLDDGAYGADLAGDFLLAVDDDSLYLTEVGTVLTHGNWYAVRSAGGWPGVDPFEVHVLLAVGDADGDGTVLPPDLSLINASVPSFAVSWDCRADINGDGRVLPNDLSIANGHIPTFAVPKPSGH